MAKQPLDQARATIRYLYTILRQPLSQAAIVCDDRISFMQFSLSTMRRGTKHLSFYKAFNSDGTNFLIVIIENLVFALYTRYCNVACIQDTLSSRARLAFRPSASREQRYLAYNNVARLA